MTETTIGAVLVGPRKFELRELPLPSLNDDDGLLRVNSCGLCGTDLEQYMEGLSSSVGPNRPFIPGHEPVGVVEAIGERAAARWGIAIGDRVVVEPSLSCDKCKFCCAGRYTLCEGWSGSPAAYGFVPLDDQPGLWGGYAHHLYLHPRARIHRVPDTVSDERAVLFNPLGAGFRWAVDLPQLHGGEVVVVLGAGQRGLACVVAAVSAGASRVFVTGLRTDSYKLKLAVELGAECSIVVDHENVVTRVEELTCGGFADLVVDTTAGSTEPVRQAIKLVRRGGTVVLAGLKSGREVAGFASDDVVLREIRILGARGVDGIAYREALSLIAADPTRLDRMRTHSFPLSNVSEALEVLAGERPGELAINVTVNPWAEE